jgi:hypothetical protein
MVIVLLCDNKLRVWEVLLKKRCWLLRWLSHNKYFSNGILHTLSEEGPVCSLLKRSSEKIQIFAIWWIITLVVIFCLTFQALLVTVLKLGGAWEVYFLKSSIRYMIEILDICKVKVSLKLICCIFCILLLLVLDCFVLHDLQLCLGEAEVLNEM